ncbi:Glucanosyltransferase-domain-containing protein [Tricharina praecox]|uniref:Glucanosyltransferase-domain-containing protein n=1 Tax=Tricharina praecox TaxID=43433 RepID=UPI00221FB834|nr:Glucanosyltransferase-domain-containing protein [Tricharina praecox]KAI5846020.1 Glucanosyltransferase-domain-containing protein [Tricharina praecox]
MRGILSLAAAVAMLGSASAALDPVTVKGNAFFVGDERFYIRGVDYQPGGQSNLMDPIANLEDCQRDIPLFKELGLNAIRIYTVDNSADHDECMKELDDAGIYLLLDVNTPTISINRADPAATYNEKYLQHVFATIDVFSKYDNTLAFFSANEVVNDVDTTGAATYVKAVTRDMRKYIKERKLRSIPVGYSAADVAENRMEVAKYLNCGDDEDARSDFFAVNDYSWCGDSSFTTSNWNEKVENYTDYSIPIFLSEYGCNVPSPRKFGEVTTLYSDKMSPVFSGGLVFEYSQEPNNFGLVEISDDRASVDKLGDFEALKEQFSKAKNPSGDGGFQEGLDVSECPGFVQGRWEANNTLPTLPSAAQKYYTEGAGKPLGDQNLMAGGTTTGSASGTSSAKPSGTGSGDTNAAPSDRSFSAVVLACIVGASTLAGAMFVM